MHGDKVILDASMHGDKVILDASMQTDENPPSGLALGGGFYMSIFLTFFDTSKLYVDCIDTSG
jgi:hypothetical protein